MSIPGTGDFHHGLLAQLVSKSHAGDAPTYSRPPVRPPRRDRGSQYMSDDFQAAINFLGIDSSPAFVRQPEGNGCIDLPAFFGPAITGEQRRLREPAFSDHYAGESAAVWRQPNVDHVGS